MANSTPTKIVSRVALSPNSKDSTCIVCLEVILNPDYKRRLFSNSKDGTNKTQACINLEIVVGEKFTTESCPTKIICRKCERKNESFVKKITELREHFLQSKSTLEDRGSKSE